MPGLPAEKLPPLSELAELGAKHLGAVIAIDSQSDERSETIPSTEGQRRLSAHLRSFFEGLGFSCSTDEAANLLVTLPASETPASARSAPHLAFMVHMDTSRGTAAVDRLCEIPAWDGSRIPYPKNDKLQVSVENYPETAAWQGDDLLHGPGEAPIGLDDKLGMAELMTLATLLSRDPSLPRPPLTLVFRPDEEIGRMAAVVGLAEELQKRGVRYGYTVDGLAPFEINVENFNASRAVVQVAGRPLEVLDLPCARRITLQVDGAKSHGATAKAEGYLNPTVVFARALAPLSRRNDILPLSFASDVLDETSAIVTFALRAEDDAGLERARAALLEAFEKELAPHAWKGAEVTVRSESPMDPKAPLTDEGMRLFAVLATFLRTPGPSPLLSEESDGYQGYSNPCFVHPDDGGLRLEWRLRDFTEDGLAAREAHVKHVCSEGPGELPLTVTRQYVNMGPALKPFPQLVTWAEEAATRAGVKVLHRPIRGGTGVDPFLDRGLPVANLGTGYFAPESEKEFTSKQKIGQHASWLCHLCAVVAEQA